MADTKIEWAEKVWNPVTGCTPVSEGCWNCYAKRMANGRLRGRFGYPADDPFQIILHSQDVIEKPLHWKKPRRIFVCSMGDPFHDKVPDHWLDEIGNIIQKCPQHQFLILTKRPENMLRYFKRIRKMIATEPPHEDLNMPNVWLGVSVEDQKTADERIPILLNIPAAKRFVSIEPMLGDINLIDYVSRKGAGVMHGKCFNRAGYTDSLDWVIVGGESGPGARPMHPDWVRSIRDQCVSADVPFFFKQWGKWKPMKPKAETFNDESIEDYLKQNGRVDVFTWNDGNFTAKIGKKKAGRTIDGETWGQFPQV